MTISVLGSRFSVLGSRFSVLGSRFSVLGSRFSVLVGSLYTISIALGLLLLTGCGGGGRAGYTSQQQTIEGMTITLERPQQIAVLQDYEFFVTLTDSAGKRIDGATVYLEQDMPAMKMGSNQPLGEPLGNGQYRLKGVFTMDGAWKLVVHASVAGKDYAATFDQQVTPVQ